MLSVNSIQDTVQALAIQNIMNTNVHVEKEQLLRSMTTFQDLESIVYIFTALHVAKSIVFAFLDIFTVHYPAMLRGGSQKIRW